MLAFFLILPKIPSKTMMQMVFVMVNITKRLSVQLICLHVIRTGHMTHFIQTLETIHLKQSSNDKSSCKLMVNTFPHYLKTFMFLVIEKNKSWIFLKF